MNSEVFTGQAITCGGWSLAISMQWANAIVDTFELVKIPRAPNWLIGAVNIDGRIIPVVDLSVYFVPSVTPMAIDRHHRILVGGKREAGTEDAAASYSVLAILFNGLPMQIEYTLEALDENIVIPKRLRELSLGITRSPIWKNSFEIDGDKLIEFLSLNSI